MSAEISHLNLDPSLEGVSRPVLYDRLTILGDWYPLRPLIRVLEVEAALAAFENRWRPHSHGRGNFALDLNSNLHVDAPSLHEFLRPFAPHLAPSYFLRLDAGGFVPFHRENPAQNFRIFIPLGDHPRREFVFFLGDKQLQMEAGLPYFIDTRREHAFFSFYPGSTQLVLNIELNPASVSLVHAMLYSR